MLLAISYLGTLHFVALCHVWETRSLSEIPWGTFSAHGTSTVLTPSPPRPPPFLLLAARPRFEKTSLPQYNPTMPEYTTLHAAAAEVVAQRGQWVGVGDSRRRPQSWHKPLACAVLLQVHWWTSDPMGDALGGGHVWWRWRLVEIPTDIREAQQCSRG